jgi:hypothetical protein
MSNDNKDGNVNGRGGSGKNDPNRGNDTTQTGQQSQDAVRHQQEGSHHPKDKSEQQGGSGNKIGQQSQGGSQKDSEGMKQRGSDHLANDQKQRRNEERKDGQSK